MVKNVKDKKLYVKLMFELITTEFNLVNSNQNQQYLPTETWKKTYGEILHTIHFLEENQELIVVETQKMEKEKEDEEIVGNFVSFLEKMDNEFIKNLQYIDPHTQEYVERLIDIRIIIELCERIFIYYKNLKNFEKATISAVRLFNHLYYLKISEHKELLEKRLVTIEEVTNKILTSQGLNYSILKKEERIINNDLNELLKYFIELVNKYGDEKSKIQVSLQYVFFLSKNDLYYESKDLFLSLNLQDTIQKYDIPIQILYNRSITQLGKN
jgi:translation initiation factor 3 subunit C